MDAAWYLRPSIACERGNLTNTPLSINGLPLASLPKASEMTIAPAMAYDESRIQGVIYISRRGIERG